MQYVLECTGRINIGEYTGKTILENTKVNTSENTQVEYIREHAGKMISRCKSRMHIRECTDRIQITDCACITNIRVLQILENVQVE